jgi:hypothetical protein
MFFLPNYNFIPLIEQQTAYATGMLKETDTSASKFRNETGCKNFMFHISVCKRSTRVVPLYSRKHQGAILGHPGSTVTLLY